MAIEIERKFLLRDTSFLAHCKSEYIAQAYLVNGKEMVVRVRICGERAWLTVKSSTIGCTRNEYEYEIPRQDAQEMIDSLCSKPFVEKRRFCVPVDGFCWEIDRFEGANQGLVVAEIELPNESVSFALPAWVGDEVTGDPRYYNSSLAQNPYSVW